MISRRKFAWSVALVGLGMSVIERSMMGQRGNPAPQLPGAATQPGQIGLDPHDRDEMSRMEEKQSKLRNDDRQKRLVSDTEKLFELATALRNDVAKTDKNVLSLDVIRRADEIEKLAHSVKDRMKG